MSQHKKYDVTVAVTIKGVVEVCAPNKKVAQREIQKLFDKGDFCDLRHNIKNPSQINFVPISYIKPSKK